MYSITSVLSCLTLLIVLTMPSFAANFDEDINSAFKSGDYAKMQKLCTAEENKHNVRAQFWLGAMYEAGTGVSQDFKEAKKWYLLAAEKGDADSQERIANMYIQGIGVPKDVKEGLIWCNKAAVGGNLGAQSNLGTFYEEGKIVQQDYAESLKWYRMAAENENIKIYKNSKASSAIRLSYMYSNGIGVSQDDKEAKKWLQVVSKYGETILLTIKGDILFPESSYPPDTLPNQIVSEPQNVAIALELYKIVAGRNDVKMMMRLGDIYNEGRSVPRNYPEAIKWFSKAVELNNVDAKNKLGDLYKEGLGVPQNYKKAIKLYQSAANQGDYSATSNLAKMYENGYGVSKNLKEAVRLYESATYKLKKKIMSEPAMSLSKAASDAVSNVNRIILSRMQMDIGIYYYEGGSGLTKDYVKSYAWFTLSAANGHEKSKEIIENLAHIMNRSQIEKAQKLAKVLWAK